MTGPLLVFALLVMPAATAQAITPRPALSLALTVLLALGVAWLGVGISYFSPYPASFFIATVAFAIYVLVRVPAALTGRRVRGPSRAPGRAGSDGGDRLMFAQEFMRNALIAGTAVALTCGVCGWFVVLRGQVFAGDALSHVAIPGALAAAAAGIDERVGLFVATVAVGAGIGLLGAGAVTGAPAGPPSRCPPTTPRSGSSSRSYSGSGSSF